MYTPANEALAKATFSVLLSRFLSFMHPLCRKVVSSMLTDRLRSAFGFAPPPQGLASIVPGLLYARAAFIRYFLLPRRMPLVRTALRANKEGKYVPNLPQVQANLSPRAIPLRI